MNKPNKFPLKMNLQHFAEGGENIAGELKNLQTSFQTSWNELKGLLDQQADEIRTSGETQTQTADKIKSVETKLTTYDTEMKGLQDKISNFEKQFNRLPFTQGQEDEIKSAGTLLFDSEDFQKMLKNNGKKCENVMVKSFFRKDLDSQFGSGGTLISPLRVPQIISAPDTELRLRDLLRVQPTTSNAIEFIQETGFVNNASPVPEKALKPESDLTFDVKSSRVVTLAHWIPATNQVLADANQLRGYVDNRLVYGLKLVEEGQILYGDGTGENLQGIMTNPLIQDAGAMGEDTMIDHIRRAITRSVLAGYPVTGIVMNPVDWAEIELSKGDDGHYIWVNIQTGGQPRLWAVPVVQSLGMAEGDFLLGGFGLGATLYDREQASVRVGEPLDFFLRNQVAILAEERLALATFRPESFVRGSFGA